MRIARRFVHVVVLILALVVGVTGAAIIVSQTAWFKNWLRGYIVREANQYLNGTVSIDRLGGNLFFGVEMENIGVSMDGNQVVAVKDLGVKYNVFELLTRGLAVDEIRLDHPMICLKREGDSWQLSRLVKTQQTETDRNGLGRRIAINALTISDGAVSLDTPVGTSSVAVPNKVEHLDAQLSFRYQPARYSIEITHFSFRGDHPSIALNTFSGGFAVYDETVHLENLAVRTAETSLAVEGTVQNYLTKPYFNLQIASNKLSIPEIARLVPALEGVTLQPAFDIRMQGPLDALRVRMNARSSAGQATGNIIAGLVTPGLSVQGDVSVRHVDLSAIRGNSKQKSDITADAHIDVRAESYEDLNSLRGRVSLDSPRIVAAGYTAGPIDARAQIQGRRVALAAKAQAYGASATAGGRVVMPDFVHTGASQSIAFDVNGAVRKVDLRAMPKNLNMPMVDTQVGANYHVAGAMGTGKNAARRVKGEVNFLPSSVAGAEISGGSRARFTLNGAQFSYDADAVIANLDLQRVGSEFNIRPLAEPRYQSQINARVTANGSGTTLAELTLDARGALIDTTLMGARIPELDFNADVARGNAHLTAYGSFSGFDPAVASGNDRTHGTLAGDVNVDATVSSVANGVTPDSIEATVQLDLDPSTVGGLEIASANLDAHYANATGDVRWLEIVGRDLHVDGSGAIALNDDGQSNFTVHANSPNLATIGALVNQPITGIATLDAAITGNKRELQAKGTLVGDGVTYGDNGALTASTDFTATIPELNAADMTVRANTRATFVTLRGQHVNEVQAKTDYQQPRVDFDLNAKQPQRSLSLGGSAVLAQDHQQVFLRSLGVQSQGISWQLAPGAQPAIEYGGNAVAVKDLRLVNGNQTISVDGAFGKAGEAMNVSLKNLDVGTVDALLLRPPQLAGRLDATSTLSGTTDAPTVDGQFTLTNGGFRQFHYESFGGTAKYAAHAVALDTRLQQNPTTWLKATGSIPMALFNRTAASSTEPVDLHVDSSPIDLSLVQGVTTALTNVNGTFEAHVHVTGTAGDPKPNGAVTIQNGAFRLEPTGVAYTGLQGRIDLQPDRVHIDQITLLDNQRKPITVKGDLAIDENKVGGVSIKMHADDFKVIDNDMGNVRIKTDLSLTGDITAPRVEGSLGVMTGRIDLDPILAQTGRSAYATQETPYPASKDQGQTPSQDAFQALQIDLHVTVPDDLVVRASDLRASGSPLSLGALNVTLGGDLWIGKSPWDQIRIVGPVKTIRGFYDFQGRRFTILRDGTIRFDGLDEIDPTLNVQTQRLIQAVTATVNVRGTLQHPEIALSSVPPLDPGDILSLIVFNQPLNQTTEAQQISLAQRAEQMVGGAATSALSKSIGNSLGLDLFELNLAPEQGGGPNVAVGQQFSQNLYLKVEQGIGTANQTNVILEYELTHWLRFRTNVLQGSATQQSLFQRAQSSGAALLFFFNY
jgi:autotransporter translocation and assembly factor TamB